MKRSLKSHHAGNPAMRKLRVVPHSTPTEPQPEAISPQSRKLLDDLIASLPTMPPQLKKRAESLPGCWRRHRDEYEQAGASRQKAEMLATDLIAIPGHS